MKKNIMKIFGIGAAFLMVLLSLTPFVCCQPSQNNLNVPKETKGFCCFAAGTKITMADGSYKNIEDVKVGDLVLSYNIKYNKFSSWRVKFLSQPMHPVYEINDGIILMTADHPLRIQKINGQKTWGVVDLERGKKATRLGENIAKIELGDKLFTEKGKWIEVTKISFRPEVVRTYDLISISGKQTYFANGILVHEENPPINPFWINWFINKFFEKFPNAFLVLKLITGK
jgi:hypothetical protein